jgi:hypothetical protein
MLQLKTKQEDKQGTLSPKPNAIKHNPNYKKLETLMKIKTLLKQGYS